MSKKNINSKLYLDSKIIWRRKEHVVERGPDGYLYANGKHRTKILSTDLPKWFVHGYMYKRHGYISAKGVKHLLYVPSYVFDNHLHKDDSLLISYNAPIEPYESENGFNWYKGYDEILGGPVLVEFVKAVEKYSAYDVSDVMKEIARKREFYYERNPEQAKLAFKSDLSEMFGQRLPYRGREYILGGDGGRKPFFDNCFCVPIKYSDEQIKDACIKIYRDLARRDLTEKVGMYATKMGIVPPDIKISSAKTALGSLTQSLNFSWWLIMGNDDIIDYVVVSTLAHIIESTRSSKYWEIVGKIMPDYKEYQEQLRVFQERLKGDDWL